jgi:MerR family mercuric resistance operon transcriptional regulator
MKIGQLAKSAGVNIETVRFYERKGLIIQPIKPQEGYRQYPAKTLQRILFIKRAQKLGFTLEEISDLLAMETAKCSEVQELAKLKLADVRARLTDLSRMESVLHNLLKSCETNPNNAECPIIDTLIEGN